METKVTTHITQGLLISLVLILISITAYITGQDQASWARWIGNIILFGGVLASCIVYANQLNNNVTFGNVFAHGFKVSAVVTCLMIVFMVLFVLFMPDIKEKAMEAARAKMVQQGQSEETIQMGLNITSKFFYAFIIGAILVIYLFIGVIASLIGAAGRKEKPNQPI